MKELRATRVVHCSVEIARQPSVVWSWILNDIAAGQHYARLGYRIDPSSDPTSHLKTYRLHFKSADRVDDIMAAITELDDKAMRLSMFAQFFSPQARGLVAHVTYQAVARGNDSLLQMSCHATFDLDVDEHASAEEIARSAEAGRHCYERDTTEWFDEIKVRLESSEAAS